MRVVHLERFRFHVSSRSRATVHLVDLEENEMLGQCGCEDFTTRRNIAFKAGARDETARCDHCRAATLFLAQMTMVALAYQQPKPQRRHLR